jgi:competence protein ComEA
MPRILLLAVPALALLGAGMGLALRPAEPEPFVEIDEPPEETAASALLVVDVVGAVTRPGIVQLPPGSRVIDALLAAGGMTADADPAALNKAALVRDGARIYVPRPGEQPPAGTAGMPSESAIDINRASSAELESLPGIGPSTASRIIRSREGKPFARVEELQTRGLVSARVFADVKDLVTTR